MEALREDEVLALEEDILRKLEERLTPIMHQVAADAAKKAMHELRLDLLSHLSRHEIHIKHLNRAEAALSEVSGLR